MVGIIGTVANIVGVNMIPLPNKKYNIIYADPAWNFKSYSDKGKDRSPDKHYPVMSIQNIKDLPIQDISHDDCILFMWVTFPLLKQGFEVIDAWGFTYKTVAFNWVKKNKKSDSWFWGLGYWTRANAELCLLATRGTIKRQSASVHQIIDTRIEKHSKKPDIVRDKIIELVGDLPRIELFARETSEGWDSWGNEI
jgi:N6-adenosine-specific RNA methylase IME4